jgi:hypothetical protein
LGYSGQVQRAGSGHCGKGYLREISVPQPVSGHGLPDFSGAAVDLTRWFT